MSEQNETPWVALGPHVYRFEPSADIVFMKLRGDVAVEDTRMFVAALERFSETREVIFLLADASGLGDISAEARRVLAEIVKNVPIGATAFFGASFPQRVMMTLADRVNNLVRANRYETRFFKDEADARAWLERKKRRAPSAQL